MCVCVCVCVQKSFLLAHAHTRAHTHVSLFVQKKGGKELTLSSAAIQQFEEMLFTMASSSGVLQHPSGIWQQYIMWEKDVRLSVSVSVYLCLCVSHVRAFAGNTLAQFCSQLMEHERDCGKVTLPAVVELHRRPKIGKVLERSRT